ncbi:MAG: pyrimidine-specific ribonucleoside hydrolase [Cellvibrionaceae bacterium]|jgi:pyrimidine-specific ribonucleoside hydrolase
MSKKAIFLDCDPGHDDAIALILALASPELDVLGVSTSAGNQTADKTLNNALRVLTLLNRPDIPVAGGAHKPIRRELIIADNVHGETGNRPNADVVLGVDRQGFVDLLVERLAFYG